MANYYNQREEHAFIKFGEMLKGDDPCNLILLYGVEEYLTEWAAEELVKKHVNEATKAMDYIVFEEGNFDIEKVKEACETVPMFSQKKVIQIENFTPLWGRDLKYMSEADAKEMIKLLEDIPQTALIIILAGENQNQWKSSKSELFKAIEKKGQAYNFENLSETDLRKFIEKRLRLGNKRANKKVIDLLISESGYYNKEIDYALFNLENDIKKIVALSEEEVTEDDVIKSVSNNLEHNTFKMLDAISNNKKEETFKLLYDLLKSGESHFKLLASIISQLEVMLEVKEMKNKDMTPAQMKKILKIHEFRIKKALQFSSKYTEKKLRNMLKLAFNVEKNIKFGFLSQDMAMEMLIAEI